MAIKISNFHHTSILYLTVFDANTANTRLKYKYATFKILRYKYKYNYQFLCICKYKYKYVFDHIPERLGLSDSSHHPSDETKGGKAHTPRLPQGMRNAYKKTAWGFGTRKQNRGSTAGRRIANKSSDGEPKARSRVVATSGWRDHADPIT